MGVTEQRVGAYSMDYIMFTSAKAKDEAVYKILDTMMKNKPDLVAVAPVLNELTPELIHRKRSTRRPEDARPPDLGFTRDRALLVRKSVNPTCVCAPRRMIGPDRGCHPPISGNSEIGS